MHRNKEQPLLAATRESLHAAMKTQHSQKYIKKERKKKKKTIEIDLWVNLILELSEILK